MRRCKLVTMVAALAALAVPSSAAAASSSSTSDLTGTVISELSLAVGTPGLLNLDHSPSGATTSSLVTVTSTSPTWTLSVSDADATTPGRMDACGGTGTPASLANALQWAPDGSTFADLTGTPATVGTGSLIDTETVTYKQVLDPGEDVTFGDCYQLTATYTVTDS